MKKEILIGMLLLISAMGVVSVSGEEMVTTSFFCDRTSVEVGETFKVELWVDTNFPVTGFTLLQLQFPGNLGDMTNRLFGYQWNLSSTDIGYLDNDEGNLTYVMAFNFDGISGNQPVLEFTFRADSPGTFTLHIPEKINFGPGAGSNGMEIASDEGHVFGITPEDISITIKTEDSGNGGSGSGGSGGSGNGGTTPPVDSDGDGVPDGEDICPGHDDNQDSDGDGIPDGCDEFPYGEDEIPDEPDEPDEEPKELIAILGGPYFAGIGDTVIFDGSASSGDITLWSWDFGDGSGSNYETVTHKYNKEGTYVVTLSVGDKWGNLDFNMTYVYVTTEYEPEPDNGQENGNGGDWTYLIVLCVVFAIIVFMVFFLKNRREYE